MDFNIIEFKHNARQFGRKHRHRTQFEARLKM